MRRYSPFSTLHRKMKNAWKHCILHIVLDRYDTWDVTVTITSPRTLVRSHFTARENSSIYSFYSETVRGDLNVKAQPRRCGIEAARRIHRRNSETFISAHPPRKLESDFTVIPPRIRGILSAYVRFGRHKWNPASVHPLPAQHNAILTSDLHDADETIFPL